MKGKPTVLTFALVLLSLIGLAQRISVNTPLERGQYDGVQKVGTWEYYDRPHKLSLRVDYDNGRLLYVEKDTADFLVLQDDKLTPRKLNIPSRFHGSRTNFLAHFIQGFSWPQPLVESVSKTGKSFLTYLTFDVYPDGTAKNPVVHNNPGGGVRESLLNIFQSIPPWWIVGIDQNDSTHICRFAVAFTLCGSECPDIAEIKNEGKLIINFKTQVKMERQPMLSPFLINDESSGIEFSPDHQRILIDATGVYIDTVETAQSPAIVDLGGKLLQRIEYGEARGAWWISNNEILLRYQYLPLPTLLARRNATTGVTRTVSDSVTYCHRISADRKWMAFISMGHDGKYINLWLLNLLTGKVEPLFTKVYTLMAPRGWSENGRYLVLERRTENSGDIKSLLDIQTLKEYPLPILNGDVFGWSEDGSKLYLGRTKLGDYEILGSIYEYSMETRRLQEINEKIKGLYRVAYNPKANQFLLNIKGKMYVMAASPGAEPEPLFDDVRDFEWHPDGTGVVYQNRKDWQLWYWSRAQNTHTQLTKGSPPEKKKKKK